MKFFDLFLYIFLPFSLGVYFYLKRKFSYFERLKVPHLPLKWPLGNMEGLGIKFHMFDLILKVYNECKGKDVICGFYNLTQPVYVVLDPEVVRAITVKDFNYFVNRGVYANEENEPLSGHIFAMKDDRWRFLRSKLTPAFSSGKIKSMSSVIFAKGDNLISAIEKSSINGRSIEVKNIANRFTVDVICSVAFGIETNTLSNENERMISIFREIFESEGSSTFAFLLSSGFPKIAKFLKMRIFSENIRDFFTKTVAANIKHREDSNDNRKDFLNMLIQLKNKGSIDGEFSKDVRKLTLNEIMAQAFLFFFAGSDTSSTTISFALAELSNNQEIQEKLRKEIEERTKETNGEITYEILFDMKYLDMVVNETLRFHSVGFTAMRIASADYRVPNTNHVIKKDTHVWIPNIGFHRDEKYWKNPQQFDPENFSPEENVKRPSFVFMPFGEGPRNCIGMRFALVNVKFAIASIVKNFQLFPDPRTLYPIKINPGSPQLEAVDGFWIKFIKIKISINK